MIYLFLMMLCLLIGAYGVSKQNYFLIGSFTFAAGVLFHSFLVGSFA